MKSVLAAVALAAGADAQSALSWANSGFVVDVNGFEQNLPKNLMLWHRDASVPNDNEYFSFTSAGQIMWKNLCVESDDYHNGSPVQVNNCRVGDPTQNWKLVATQWGFQIQSQATGKCWNVDGNKGANMQKIQTWDCYNQQVFSFNTRNGPSWPVGPQPGPGPNPNPGPAPGTPTCGICMNSGSNKCYDRYGFQDYQCKCVNNDGDWPAHCGTSWYQWICKGSKGVAYIDSGCTACHGGCGGAEATKKLASPQATSALSWANSGFVVDVNGFEPASSVKDLMLWRRDGSIPNDNEFFSFNSDSTIQWKGLCVENDAGTNGSPVQVNSCRYGDLSQKWNLVSTAFGGFQIQSQHSGRCWNVAGNQGQNMAKIQVWDCYNQEVYTFNNRNGDSWPVGPQPGPNPNPGPAPGTPTCGICMNSGSNKCYGKWGFQDSQCKCVNNDGDWPAHCGTSWYQWICNHGTGKGAAFIDSGCKQCHGGCSSETVGNLTVV